MRKKLYIFHYIGESLTDDFAKAGIKTADNYMWIIDRKSLLGYIMVILMKLFYKREQD